ncbi:MAG: NirD/YgiW/YdeI family stress tolerance protein [Aeromonas sobria]
MKAITVATLTMLTVLSLPSFAAYNGPEHNVSASEVKSQRDESWVTLQGKLVKRLGEDSFMFRDSTGEIMVEIDDESWVGQEISPNDTVRISGEVDQDWSDVKVDVSSLSKVGGMPVNLGGFSVK